MKSPSYSHNSNVRDSVPAALSNGVPGNMVCDNCGREMRDIEVGRVQAQRVGCMWASARGSVSKKWYPEDDTNRTGLVEHVQVDLQQLPPACRTEVCL